MKKFILLSIILLFSCSKEESVIEKINSNPDLLNGTWRYNRLLNGFEALGLRYHELIINSKEEKITWINEYYHGDNGTWGRDSSFTVHYKVENSKIDLYVKNNSNFKGEYPSL